MLTKHQNNRNKAKSNPLQITEPGTQKRHNSCSENFEKIPRKKSVKLYFLKNSLTKDFINDGFLSPFPNISDQLFQRTPPDGCF